MISLNDLYKINDNLILWLRIFKNLPLIYISFKEIGLKMLSYIGFSLVFFHFTTIFNHYFVFFFCDLKLCFYIILLNDIPSFCNILFCLFLATICSLVVLWGNAHLIFGFLRISDFSLSVTLCNS